jgi:hypothetical protein
MAGPVKRPHYRPERKPGRLKGVLHNQAPVACLDANTYEIAMALASICDSADVVVGRGGEYDSLRDEYTIVGKSKITGKAQDFTVPGAYVAALIMGLRALNGGKFDKRGLTKSMGAAPF